jgi:Domain of unknown function (DUF4159)
MSTCIVMAGTILCLASEQLARAQFFFDDGRPRTEVAVDGSEFVFARLIYRSGRFRGSRGCGNWRTDYPNADVKFMFGVERLSNIRILVDERIQVDIMEPALFDYPLVYAVEVGCMELSEAEAGRLREYMERGGFLVVDDFWGTAQWDNFSRQVRKLFPDREVEEIPRDHGVFHSFFDIDETLQVPVYRSACRGGPTYEQDGYKEYALAVFDDARRPMLMINHNTDLGDAWEWADLPCYPHKYSGFAYRMGINFIVYAMTH